MRSRVTPHLEHRQQQEAAAASLRHMGGYRLTPGSIGTGTAYKAHVKQRVLPVHTAQQLFAYLVVE
jgi:hypothetical protein